jgi:hypothetical protein
MIETSPEYPISEPEDSDEVVLALETGRALWGKGDLRDAVRWLRRAAEKAVRAGQNARAATLARAAAELGTQVGAAPAPVVIAPATPPAPPPILELETPDLDGDFADKTIVDKPTDAQARQLMVAAARTKSRQALRVAVELASPVGDVLTVRLLDESQKVPPGSHEALLVALVPGVDLTRKKL